MQSQFLKSLKPVVPWIILYQDAQKNKNFPKNVFLLTITACRMISFEKQVAVRQLSSIKLQRRREASFLHLFCVPYQTE